MLLAGDIQVLPHRELPGRSNDRLSKPGLWVIEAVGLATLDVLEEHLN